MGAAANEDVARQATDALAKEREAHAGTNASMTEALMRAEEENERMRDGIGRCYRMLLSEPDTKGALFKAENILRDLMTPNNRI